MNELTLEEKLQSIVGAMDLIAGDGISLDRLEINAADYDAIIGPELAKWPTPSTRVFQKRLGFLMNREIVAIGKAQRGLAVGACTTRLHLAEERMTDDWTTCNLHFSHLPHPLRCYHS